MVEWKSVLMSMIEARARKINRMADDFEPTQRIAKYKTDSLLQIKSTYKDLMRKTRIELAKIQSEMRGKYAGVVAPLDSDSRNREIIRYGALPTNDLKKMADGIIGTDLPIKPETAFIISRELRSRGGKDQLDLADRLAGYAVGYLEQPWVTDPEYRRIEHLIKRTEVYEANDGQIVLSLEPREGDVLIVEGEDISQPHVPGANRRQETQDAIREAVSHGLSTS